MCIDDEALDDDDDRGTPPALRSPRRKRRSRTDDRCWLFVAPFAIVFTLVFLAPLVSSISPSLFREQLIGGNAFVGLDNYIAAFGDEKFWDGLIRVSVFLVVQVPIMLLLALGAALAIDSARLHASSFYRIVIFLPYAVPAVVAVLMWGCISGDQLGLAGTGHDGILRFTLPALAWVRLTARLTA